MPFSTARARGFGEGSRRRSPQRRVERHRLDRAQRDADRPGRDPHRGEQRLASYGIQRNQGQREAVHVQRGHERRRPKEELDALGQRRAQELMRDHRHLQRRHAAQVVEKEPVPGVILRERGVQPLRHQRDQRAHRTELDPLAARLAVDPQTQLQLIVD